MDPEPTDPPGEERWQMPLDPLAPVIGQARSGQARSDYYGRGILQPSRKYRPTGPIQQQQRACTMVVRARMHGV